MPSSLFNLQGKRALITGATQGIGAALSKGLGEAGAELIINARDRSKLDTYVSSLQASGMKVHGALFDITDAKAVQQSVAHIEQTIGPIDILVNNAGIIKRAPAEELSEEDWQSVLHTDLTAPFFLCKY